MSAFEGKGAYAFDKLVKTPSLLAEGDPEFNAAMRKQHAANHDYLTRETLNTAVANAIAGFETQRDTAIAIELAGILAGYGAESPPVAFLASMFPHSVIRSLVKYMATNTGLLADDHHQVDPSNSIFGSQANQQFDETRHAAAIKFHIQSRVSLFKKLKEDALYAIRPDTAESQRTNETWSDMFDRHADQAQQIRDRLDAGTFAVADVPFMYYDAVLVHGNEGASIWYDAEVASLTLRNNEAEIIQFIMDHGFSKDETRSKYWPNTLQISLGFNTRVFRGESRDKSDKITQDVSAPTDGSALRSEAERLALRKDPSLMFEVDNITPAMRKRLGKMLVKTHAHRVNNDEIARANHKNSDLRLVLRNAVDHTHMIHQAQRVHATSRVQNGMQMVAGLVKLYRARVDVLASSLMKMASRNHHDAADARPPMSRLAIMRYSLLAVAGLADLTSGLFADSQFFNIGLSHFLPENDSTLVSQYGSDHETFIKHYNQVLATSIDTKTKLPPETLTVNTNHHPLSVIGVAVDSASFLGSRLDSVYTLVRSAITIAGSLAIAYTAKRQSAGNGQNNIHRGLVAARRLTAPGAPGGAAPAAVARAAPAAVARAGGAVARAGGAAARGGGAVARGGGGGSVIAAGAAAAGRVVARPTREQFIAEQQRLEEVEKTKTAATIAAALQEAKEKAERLEVNREAGDAIAAGFLAAVAVANPNLLAHMPLAGVQPAAGNNNLAIAAVEAAVVVANEAIAGDVVPMELVAAADMQQAPLEEPSKPETRRASKKRVRDEDEAILVESALQRKQRQTAEAKANTRKRLRDEMGDYSSAAAAVDAVKEGVGGVVKYIRGALGQRTPAEAPEELPAIAPP